MNKTFHQIQKEDFNEITKDHVPFSERYKSSIMSNRFDVASPLAMFDKEGIIQIIPNNFVLPRVSIYEIPDEYFIIRAHYHYSSEKFLSNQFYKCDQIEGVIDCLKEVYKYHALGAQRKNKYIREYYNHVSKIEELSDYLQEFFDKYNIKQLSTDRKMLVYDNEWTISSDKGILVYLSEDTYEPFKKDIRESNTLLEVRLGSRINILAFDNRKFIVIEI